MKITPSRVAPGHRMPELRQFKKFIPMKPSARTRARFFLRIRDARYKASRISCRKIFKMICFIIRALVRSWDIRGVGVRRIFGGN